MESLGRWLVTQTWSREQRETTNQPQLTGVTANALKAFVRERFGEEAVRHALRQQQHDMQVEWNRRQLVEGMVKEEAYLSMAIELCSASNMDMYDFLFEFGQHFLDWLAVNAGYGRSIHRVAATFADFCRGLNQFMNSMFASIGNVKNKMPHVAVKDETADSFVLLLFGSSIPTRPPVLLGALDRIATSVFGLKIAFERLPDPSPGCQAMRVSMTSTSSSRPLRRADTRYDYWLDTEPTIVGPRPEDFYTLFPFHFVMDRQFRLVQAGSGLERLIPEMATPGVQVDKLLTILHPTVIWDIAMLDMVLDNRMTSKVVFESTTSLLDLKGGLYKMRPTQERLGGGPGPGTGDGRGGSILAQQEEVLVFLGSPNCFSFDNMAAHGLYLSDLPAHDLTPDFVLMADHRRAKMRDLEQTSATLLEEQRHNLELKQTLAEALASQIDEVGKVSTNSAVGVTLQLLDAIIMREDVDMNTVLYVRDSLLRAGTNVWAPVEFDARNIDPDQEVNAALGSMLGTFRSELDHVDVAELATPSTSRTGSSVSDTDRLGDTLDDASGRASAPQPSGDTLVLVQPLQESSSRQAPAIRLLLEPTTELNTVLQGVDGWHFDVFALDRASNGHPLSCLAYHLFRKMDIIKHLRLSESKLIRFLLRIEQGYSEIPYHSRVHGADVLRVMHAVCTQGGVIEQLVAAAKLKGGAYGQMTPTTLVGGASTTALDHSDNVLASQPFKLLAAYMAAIVHDYDHKGVNNDFLVKSGDKLAMLYNDMSPMENHHVASALSLLREESHAFIPNTSKLMHDTLRKLVIDMVLATDMKQHFTMVGIFNSMVKHDHPDSDSSRASTRGSVGHRRMSSFDAGIRHGCFSENGGATAPSWDAETQGLVLKMALKVADLGHSACGMASHKIWVQRLEKEMFKQGDMERALGLPVSPLMDRNKGGVAKSQCGFFSIVAIPLFKAFAEVFPGIDGLLTQLLSNYQHWRQLECMAAAANRQP